MSNPSISLPPPRPTASPLLPLALLASMVLVVYWPATGAGFVWDDDKYVTENPLLVEKGGLGKIWFSTEHPSQYFPLVYTTFWIEKRIWELDPTGYHATNIVLHLANSLLLFLLLRRLRLPGALLASLLFALHPVQVESVAWITERKNVLSLFFSILSVWGWVAAVDRSDEGKRAGKFLALSLLAYVAALFSKTTACTLPAALVLVQWVRYRPLSVKRWLQISLYVLLGLLMGLLTLWWEQDNLGLHPEASALSKFDRVLVASRALWFYLFKLSIPLNLSFSYPKWTVDASDPIQLCALAGILVVPAVLWQFRRRLSRGPIASLAFFAATLSPMLGLISLYTFFYTYVADHYQYVASIGPFCLVGATMSWVGSRCRRLGNWILIGGAAVVIALLSLATRAQIAIYDGPLELWHDTLEKNPDSWMAHNNLGTTYQSLGELDRALDHYRRAVEIKPGYGQLHFNLGAGLQMAGKVEEAVSWLETSADLDPKHAGAYNNLGLAYQMLGRPDRSATCFRRAIELEPEAAGTYYNFGAVLRNQGKLDQARFRLEQAVALDPHLAPAQYALGALLQSQGDLVNAETALRRAISVDPENPGPRLSLGTLLRARGQIDEALGSLRSATRLKPDWGEAWRTLAWTLATCAGAREETDGEAVRAAERAVSLSPAENLTSLDTLAAALAQAGRFPEAITKALEAARMADRVGSPAAAEVKKRLDLYRRREPYRSP